jgi:hypothetical protein
MLTCADYCFEEDVVGGPEAEMLVHTLIAYKNLPRVRAIRHEILTSESSLHSSDQSLNMTNSLTDSQASALIEATSVSIFNERDPKKRRELMTQHWSEQITCFSPFGANQGFDSIDQVWEGACWSHQGMSFKEEGV